MSKIVIKGGSKELLDLIFPTLPIAIFCNALLTLEDLFKCGKDSGLDFNNFLRLKYFYLFTNYRNSVPVVEVFRRWSGKDGIPILEKLDKKSAKLEKMYRMHNETIEALQAKLERLQEKEGNI